MNELKNINIKIKSRDFKKSIFTHDTKNFNNISSIEERNIWFGSLIELTNQWYFNDYLGSFGCEGFNGKSQWIYSEILNWIYCGMKTALISTYMI